jgi:mono/diheme cytochrome c family protein
MRRKGIVALASVALVGGGTAFHLASPRTPLVPAHEPGAFGFEPGEMTVDFRFRDVEGRSGRLSSLLDEHDAVVIAMRMTECPVSRRYGHRLAELERAYAERGVAFLYLTVSPQDSREKVADDRRVFGFTGPYVRDPEGRIGGLLQARVSSEAFMIDRSRTLRYRGPVDDQWGIDFAKPEPRHRFLEEALDAVLEGRPVRRPAVEASGCALAPVGTAGDGALVPARELTYHSRISRILQANCVSCHRSGGIAPFALDSYEQAHGFRHMIDFVVRDGRMPPWFASPEHGRWANARTMPERDRRDLLAWIAADAPEGDPRQAVKPLHFLPGWSLEREPDLVYRLPDPQDIPEQGTLDYRYIYVKTDHDRDLWVTAAEARPDAVEHVHHIIVFLNGPDEDRGPMLVGWAPGVAPFSWPAGVARRLPKGTWLMFEMHYTTNGRAATDQSMVGLILADEPPAREARMRWVATDEFEIPPYAANHEVVAERSFRQGGEILGFLPHMHLRGKAFRYELVRADGTEEVLLEVPRYDFNWQLFYEAWEPIRIAPGDLIRATAWYDNSEANPANPDPGAAVRWGDQSWEEMMIGFFEWVGDPERVGEPSHPTDGGDP